MIQKQNILGWVDRSQPCWQCLSAWFEWTQRFPRNSNYSKEDYWHEKISWTSYLRGLSSYSTYTIRGGWLHKKLTHLNTKINIPYFNNCNKQSPRKSSLFSSIIFLLGLNPTCFGPFPTPCLVPSTRGSDGRKSELGLTKRKAACKPELPLLLFGFSFCWRLCNAKQRAAQIIFLGALQLWICWK